MNNSWIIFFFISLLCLYFPCSYAWIFSNLHTQLSRHSTRSIPHHNRVSKISSSSGMKEADNQFGSTLLKGDKENMNSNQSKDLLLTSSLDNLRLEREKRRIEYIAADLALRKLEASLKQV